MLRDRDRDGVSRRSRDGVRVRLKMGIAACSEIP